MSCCLPPSGLRRACSPITLSCLQTPLSLGSCASIGTQITLVSASPAETASAAPPSPCRAPAAGPPATLMGLKLEPTTPPRALRSQRAHLPEPGLSVFPERYFSRVWPDDCLCQEINLFLHPVSIVNGAPKPAIAPCRFSASRQRQAELRPRPV